MKSRWARLLVLILSIPVLAAKVQGASKTDGPDWENVSSVQPGKQVIIKLHRNFGKKVKGTFVASDGDGITVRGKDGREQTIARHKVRKVKAKHKRYGLWIRIATGAVAVGVAGLSADDKWRRSILSTA